MALTSISEKSRRDLFHSYIKGTNRAVDRELLHLVSKYTELKLHEKIAYALLSAGKRLRPSLVILSAESVGGNRRYVKQLAAAIELLHTASLVHDDILDKDTLRRNVPSVYAKWGTHDAILTGDALVCIAIKVAADYGQEILKIISDTGLFSLRWRIHRCCRPVHPHF